MNMTKTDEEIEAEVTAASSKVRSKLNTKTGELDDELEGDTPCMDDPMTRACMALAKKDIAAGEGRHSFHDQEVAFGAATWHLLYILSL